MFSFGIVSPFLFFHPSLPTKGGQCWWHIRGGLAANTASHRPSGESPAIAGQDVSLASYPGSIRYQKDHPGRGPLCVAHVSCYVGRWMQGLPSGSDRSVAPPPRMSRRTRLFKYFSCLVILFEYVCYFSEKLLNVECKTHLTVFFFGLSPQCNSRVFLLIDVADKDVSFRSG